jgi:hypothetical protein
VPRIKAKLIEYNVPSTATIDELEEKANRFERAFISLRNTHSHAAMNVMRKRQLDRGQDTDEQHRDMQEYMPDKKQRVSKYPDRVHMIAETVADRVSAELQRGIQEQMIQLIEAHKTSQQQQQAMAAQQSAWQRMAAQMAMQQPLAQAMFVQQPARQTQADERRTCFGCGEYGHIARDCPNKDYGRGCDSSNRGTTDHKARDYCYRCGDGSHRAPQCQAQSTGGQHTQQMWYAAAPTPGLAVSGVSEPVWQVRRNRPLRGSVPRASGIRVAQEYACRDEEPNDGRRAGLSESARKTESRRDTDGTPARCKSSRERRRRHTDNRGDGV